MLKNKVNNGWGSVGDEIVCIVKRARPISSGPGTGAGAGAQAVSNALKVRRGDVRRAVIVRSRKSVRRPDGRWVRFDDNAAVLLNNKREMLGTRIGGVVSADLRMKGWGKIVSLAPKVNPSHPSPFLAHTHTLRLTGSMIGAILNTRLIRALIWLISLHFRQRLFGMTWNLVWHNRES